jgi:hypothetical protein
VTRKEFKDYPDASAEVAAQAKWKSGDEVPPSVCIRHGKFLPCKPFARDDDCLHTSHPAMARMVAAYQRDTTRSAGTSST